MKTVFFIFDSNQKQEEYKTLVLDVKYSSLGFKYKVNIEQRVDTLLDHPMVKIGSNSFPLYKELGVMDILEEINS